jgi:aminoglycoside phosphotransferase (APT) family kinase protein
MEKKVNPKTNLILTWIKEVCGNALPIRGMEPLKGATSSSVFEVFLTPKNESLVLRVFTNGEWLQEEPDLAKHEAGSLQIAKSLPLSTPTCIAVDETGEMCGFPAVLMTKCEGSHRLHHLETGLQPLAKALFQIHSLPVPNFEWTYFPYHRIEEIHLPIWTHYPHSWQRMIEYVTNKKPEQKKCFIHRDFHPLNVLWKGDQITGIIDWVNACIGPAGVDVGHCRLNLALLHGIETADQFLKSYIHVSGEAFVYDPYWDLKAAFEFLPGPPTVYQGWIAHGVTDLTDRKIKERFEEYILSLDRRI